MARKKHKGLWFEVEDARSSSSAVFYTFDEAATYAIARAVSHGEKVTLDVCVDSASAAKAWAGDHGVEVYKEDPEASVHERIILKAESQGRIA